MSLSNEVLKWRYVNIIHVVAVQMQMGITTSQKMLLIFEMEGVFFQSYTKDEQDFHIQREPDWQFGDRSYFLRPFYSKVLKYCLRNYDAAIWTLNVTNKYIRKVLEKSNIDIEDFKFAWDISHCHLQAKLEAGRTRQFYEKKLIDVWCQYGDNYEESNVLLINTEKHTSQFMGYRSNHILIKSYTGKEQDTWLMQVLFPFLKTLHRIKQKHEYIRMFNRTCTSL